MIDQFLSTQAKKAWVAGVLTALLQPIYTLLSGNGEITPSSLVASVLAGILNAAVVFATSNASAPAEVVDDEPGEHAAVG